MQAAHKSEALAWSSCAHTAPKPVPIFAGAVGKQSPGSGWHAHTSSALPAPSHHPRLQGPPCMRCWPSSVGNVSKRPTCGCMAANCHSRAASSMGHRDGAVGPARSTTCNGCCPAAHSVTENGGMHMFMASWWFCTHPPGAGQVGCAPAGGAAPARSWWFRTYGPEVVQH
jgi:hypothetical protein